MNANATEQKSKRAPLFQAQSRSEFDLVFVAGSLRHRWCLVVLVVSARPSQTGSSQVFESQKIH
ncbi:hypothetical protein TYRP_007584 [Tyrophagus putrescentiae]|nr:hypothetical protein TYRP_007584 [Tyrophagus putrescentiae]